MSETCNDMDEKGRWDSGRFSSSPHSFSGTILYSFCLWNIKIQPLTTLYTHTRNFILCTFFHREENTEVRLLGCHQLQLLNVCTLWYIGRRRFHPPKIPILTAWSVQVFFFFLYNSVCFKLGSYWLALELRWNTVTDPEFGKAVHIDRTLVLSSLSCLCHHNFSTQSEISQRYSSGCLFEKLT